ncbi:MAG: M90 family metallopeptidase [Candidatus Eisenbacteria bacterium]|jgi:Mlc titration factor MtfA (ptsG expression regulator)
MSWFARRHRKKLLDSPIPERWREILARNVPCARSLSDDEKTALLRLTGVFLEEKSFEGAGGFEVTEEVRVTIAAQACLLLLGRSADILVARVFPALQSVIVYPSEFVARLEEYQPDGTVYDGPEERYGESWAQGAVVLSWDDVKAGASDPADGENVVLHEFAHQLDEETGESNGVPLLSSPEDYAEWARVMSREFEEFVEKIERNRRVLLDEYAAEDPAEFFAVATEFFFERPNALRTRHPDLYRQFRTFYQQDPAKRVRS